MESRYLYVICHDSEEGELTRFNGFKLKGTF